MVVTENAPHGIFQGQHRANRNPTPITQSADSFCTQLGVRFLSDSCARAASDSHQSAEPSAARIGGTPTLTKEADRSLVSIHE